ncbi:Oxygen sensor protein DosP [Tepidimonas thermarum]|uniref:Oxygen sensor protein DosP n=1 Tax=Tepidimonas thermarum TaxID=335431 RepID=A0A554WYJ7_9BURK|nr:Oxygen sensor protein DosP [Tepidimonas thermarum]
MQLEITEDAVFDDEQGVQRTLSELQALGFGISLDDFGAGHSSLKRLMALPFCEIKIDRTFVAGLETEPRALPILDAILSVGRALGVECVAEGVEQPHQFEALQHLGCHRFQGFLFSHAVPVDAFVALVRAQRPLPPNTRVKPA